MTNKAIMHYHYAGHGDNKNIRETLPYHRNVHWSYYDAVFANSGNPPAMSEESVVESAVELQRAGVPFFWLSNYDGVGDMSGWKESNRLAFHESGARYVNISAMTLGLDALTKGSVESRTISPGNPDPHFCLAGPPDEMASLLLKIMWAVHHASPKPDSHLLMMLLAPAVVLLSFCCFVSCRVWRWWVYFLPGSDGLGRKVPSQTYDALASEDS